jgi:hypothetical protein
MFVTQIYDRKTFLEKAREMGVEVRIVRSPTVVPVTEGSAVLMHPAIRVQYAIEFPSEDGPATWIYRETHLADDRGNIKLGSALLADVEAQKLPHVILSRSGSI